MTVDIVERTKHPARSAFNTVFIVDNNFVKGFFPNIHPGGTNSRARFGFAFNDARGGFGVGVFDLNVGLMIVFVRQPTQFFIDIDGRFLLAH